MMSNRDFSCEIIGVIVLTALSAISHFWYVMIGIAVLAGLVLLSIGLLATLIRVKRGIMERFVSPSHLEHTSQIVEVSASTRAS